MQESFRADDTQIKDMRAVREQTNAVPLPDELIYAPGATVRDPTITDEIARVVATLTHRPPSCRATPVTPSDTAQKAATDLEHFLEAVLRDAGSRVAGPDTFRAATDANVGDGGAWTKLLFTPDTWEERYGLKLASYLDETDPLDEEAEGKALARYNADTENAKKRAGPPFTWLPCDALTVYPVWDGGRLAEVIEVTRRPTYPTLGQYGLTIVDKQIQKHVGQPLSEYDAKNMPHTIEMIEHWTDTWATYCLSTEGGSSKQIGRQFRHNYGRAPYFYAPGATANNWRGRKVGWGVGQSKLALVQFRAMLLSLAVQDMIKQLGKPVGIRRAQTAEPIIGDDGAPKALEDEQFALAKIFELGPEDSFVEFPGGSINPSIKEMLAYASGLIEQLDTPRVRPEIGGSMAGAGFAINQVLSEAKTKHDPFIKGLEQMLLEVSLFVLHLIRVRVKEKVWVSYSGAGTGKSRGRLIGIDETDLKQIAQIRWELDPELPSSKLVEARLYTELVQARRMSTDQAIEAEGRNPDEVRRGLRIDEMRMEPWYKVMSNLDVLQEVGQGDALARAARMAAATGVLPGMEPRLIQELIAEAQLAEAYYASLQTQNQPPAPQPQPGMGTGEMAPDMGQLTVSPQGTGAVPIRQNGSVAGAGAGMVIPGQAAAAGINSLGG